jgi:hypothetical protein
MVEEACPPPIDRKEREREREREREGRARVPIAPLWACPQRSNFLPLGSMS